MSCMTNSVCFVQGFVINLLEEPGEGCRERLMCYLLEGKSDFSFWCQMECG